MANPFDQFDAPAKAANPFDQFDAPTPSRAGEIAADVAKAVPSGLARGAVGIVGLPGAIEDGANWLARQTIGRGANILRGKGNVAPTFEEMEQRLAAAGLGSQKALPSADSIMPVVESVTGPLYKPQTMPGQYAGTIAEFIPGMVLPGGTLAQRATMAVVPAVASETAGQITEGTAAEPYARMGGALGAGLLVGGAQALARRPVNEVIKTAGGQQMTRQAVDSAAALIDDAAARGIALTWDEALNQVTGGAVNLGGIRAGAASRPEGAVRFNELASQRPGQIEAAARQQFDNIAPQAANPSSVGRAASEASEGVIDGTRQAINRATEPLYKAAEPQRISPQEFAKVQAAPGWAEARDAVRNNPQLARNVQGLPDDSVGFLNQVKIYLDTASDNAAGPLNVQRNQTVASGYGKDAGLVRQAAVDASPEYGQALAAQSAMREKYLQPLMDGPLGKIAAKDATTKGAVDALFPANPLPNSQDEVRTAVAALNAQKPRVADQLIRTHAEMVFNEATQKLQGGLNQYGGANFAAKLMGNTQQAQNLEAALTAARGPEVWKGFQRYVEILEATGKAPRVGSNTADKLAVQDAMKSGSLSSEVGNAILTGGIKVPGRIRAWYEQLQAGKNSEQLAAILTDRQSAALFRRLADEKIAPPAAIGISARLTYMAERSGENTSKPAR